MYSHIPINPACIQSNGKPERSVIENVHVSQDPHVQYMYMYVYCAVYLRLSSENLYNIYPMVSQCDTGNNCDENE